MIQYGKSGGGFLVDDATIRMFTIRLTFYSKTSNQKVSLIVRYSDFDIKTCCQNMFRFSSSSLKHCILLPLFHLAAAIQKGTFTIRN